MQAKKNGAKMANKGKRLKGTRRDARVYAFTTKEIKAAAKRAVRKRGITMSAWQEEAMIEKLAREGAACPTMT